MSDTIIVALIGAVGIVLQALLLKRQNDSERKHQNGQMRMEILLEAMEACLIGVRELGANGRTKEALRRLEDFKNKVSAN